MTHLRGGGTSSAEGQDLMNTEAGSQSYEKTDFSEVVSLIYETISGPCGPRNWDKIRPYYHPNVRLIRKNPRFPKINSSVCKYMVNECEVFPDRNIIIRRDVEAKLEPKVMDLLMFFLQKPHQLISRRELLENVWHQADCYDDSLTRAVFILRKAFKDVSNAAALIETVSKRGYRFVGSIGNGFNDTNSIATGSDVKIMSLDEYFIEVSSRLQGLGYYVSEIEHEVCRLGDTAHVKSITSNKLQEGEVVTLWNSLPLFHFVRESDEWKIINVLWDAHHNV